MLSFSKLITDYENKVQRGNYFLEAKAQSIATRFNI